MAEASDRIDPVPAWPSLRNPFGSAAEAFDAGNYPIALDMAAEGSEIRAAATIMCGAVARGLSDLAKFESPRARLVRAYAHWCLGQADDARKLLTEIRKTDLGPAATKFLDLLGDPIDIVLIATPGDEKRWSYADLPGIRVHWIQLDADQFGIAMSDALSVAVPHGARPRLLLSLDAYGPYMPSEPRAPSIPLAFWASDHDYFFATRNADFARSDLIVVNSAAEQLEIARHYATRCAAIPGHETYRQQVASGIDTPRNIDISFTGRAFTPYMRDKAQFLFRIATVDSPSIKIDITDGYLSDADYDTTLKGTKFVPIFWRSAGGIQTRAIEAMRAGASILSPEKSLMKPLLGDGAALYRSVVDSDVGTILEDRRPSGRAVSRDLDDLFWPSPKREERLIKFCLFQTLVRPEKLESPNTTYVPVELRGYHLEQGIKIYTRLARLNGDVDSPQAPHFLHAAAAAFYAAILLSDNPAAQDVGRMALDFYRTGIEAHPRSLALRFNGACALWTFGGRAEALSQFQTIVERLPDLTFDARTDSLLSHRIRVLAEMFPYGDFFRAAVEPQPGHGQRGALGPRDFIASAALGYIATDLIDRGEWAASVGLLQRALERCPVNVAAWRLMTEALARSNARPATIREAFYRAVNLYPAELFNLLPFGLDAELADDRRAEAARILRKWILAYTRIHDAEGRPLRVSDKALVAAHRHRDLLDDWTGPLFDRIVESNRDRG